jgi:hypothetical protein
VSRALEGVTMSLSFPNPSRSHDDAKHCVWFWGYDNAREITFLVADSFLAQFDSAMGSAERDVLATFDQNRDKIVKLAKGQYDGGGKNMYLIS